MDQETIVAITTPPGEGAIGVIRLSGRNVLAVVSKCIHISESPEPNKVLFKAFQGSDGNVLDEVLFTYFKGPRSYTGEDVVEFSFHGSSYILNQALEQLLEAGATMAAPGEFTQRAFLNGKFDLSQAEAVADLIASSSEAEHRMAMHQMRGGFSKAIAEMREQLIHFASLIELELDFSEEDVDFADRGQLIELIDVILSTTSGLIASFRYGNAIKTGVPVAIIGKPNAGKSTLLNALLNEEKAIVTDIAGTTRDAIEDFITIGGIKFRFIDTAGIRDTEDQIEAMGVQRSLDKIKSSAIVLYLFDAQEDIAVHEQALSQLMNSHEENILWVPVANKSDLSGGTTPMELNQMNTVSISAKLKDGMKGLEERLLLEVKALKHEQQATVVTNQRHIHALKKTEDALNQAKNAIQMQVSGDLVAADIREALHHLGSITGDISTDDLLGNIFGKFCIGK